MNHKLMSAILTYRGNYINGEFLIVLKLKIELDFFKFNDFKNILKIHRVLYLFIREALYISENILNITLIVFSIFIVLNYIFQCICSRWVILRIMYSKDKRRFLVSEDASLKKKKEKTIVHFDKIIPRTK